MNIQSMGERSPLRALFSALGGALRIGELCLMAGKPGVGKSALLVQMALDRLLREETVLHVAVGYRSQHVRDQYESILEGTFRALRPLDRAEALLQVERHRVVHSVQGAPFSTERLKALLDTLAEVVEFRPRLVVVDGWGPDTADAAKLRAIGEAYQLAICCAYTPATEQPFSEGSTADVQLEIVPERTHLRLLPHRVRHQTNLPPIRLEGTLYVAPAEEQQVGQRRPSECTLYSGGASGAEATFGVAAERWGVKEMNFTFDGHVQHHTRGAVPLTEAELAQGDVSLAYVARKLRRGFGEGTMLRRVLQSLWHQVSRAEQIFVIGTIQEDGTVTGGTGWSVELARMWNKRLWVYDQEKECWFRWNGEDWVAGTPVIDSIHYCGTGSRQVTAAAAEAIESLMERSFKEAGPRR